MPLATSQKSAREGPCRILVVDDDEAMRTLLVDALQEQKCRVIACVNGNEALDALNVIMPTIIVTDLRMPYGGYPYLQKLLEGAAKCPVAVMTAYGDSQSKARVFECGAQGYFDKPLHINDLKSWICRMCGVSSCGNSSI